jgi:soluble lytic murein transglycosylase-like protein
MPTYQWRGQSIEAPSLDAVKKYIQKQHLDGLPLKPEDDREEILNRMKPYIADVYDAEDSNEIPRGLLKKLIFQESRFREDIISGNTKSSKGATGIAQFMPATAKELGVDPTDPKQAIPGAAKYLASLKEQTGSWEGAVAAYNWGPGNVARKGIENAPQETQDYLVAVLGGNQDADK